MTAAAHQHASQITTRPECAPDVSNALLRWFGASKVVDELGSPLVVYHGSRTKGDEVIGAFSLDRIGKLTDDGWLGTGFYFGDAETASAYAGVYRHAPDAFPQGGVVYPVFLALQNPLVLRDREQHEGPLALILEHFDLVDYTSAKVIREAVIAAGFDGVMYESYAGYKEYVALHPHQIKSAVGNCGEFDPANPDICA